MRSFWLPLVLVVSMARISNAEACSTEPPMRTPALAELATTSDLVLIVHVEGIEPLSAEENAELQRLIDSPPMDTPFRFPSPAVRFRTIRMLKGHLPVGAKIRNGATSCEVILAAGYDYAIFAKMPSAKDEMIVPMNGSFYLGKGKAFETKLAELESLLSNQETTPR